MAKVRAPISGTITQVHFLLPGMYVLRGATLLSIAQDVDAPHIAFDVPVAFVDQLAVGMTGTLNIPALPQRTMPKVAVTVMAISLRAEVDEAGNPVAYKGIANIAEGGAEDISTVIDWVSLTEYMPVNILGPVRETKLAAYHVGLFLDSFSNALEN